jgi:hypothetical protein
MSEVPLYQREVLPEQVLRGRSERESPLVIPTPRSYALDRKYSVERSCRFSRVVLVSLCVSPILAYPNAYSVRLQYVYAEAY